MRFATAMAAVLFSGCYFEGSIAYHPRISQAVASGGPTLDDTSGGWSGAVNIGFYLDVATPLKRFRGFGIGWSPSYFNGYGIAPSHHRGLVRTGARGNAFRADLALPLLPPAWVEERLTLNYTRFNDTSATLLPETMSADSKSSSGHLLFLGPSIGIRIPVLTYRGVPTKFIMSLSLGVERFAGNVELLDTRTVNVSSTGVGARFMFIPAFIGKVEKGAYEDMPGGINGESHALPRTPDVKCVDNHGDRVPC